MVMRRIPWTRVVVTLLFAVSGWQLAATAAAESPVSEMRDVKLSAVAHMWSLETAARNAEPKVNEMLNIELADFAHLWNVEAPKHAWTAADEMLEVKALARVHDAFVERKATVAATR